MNDGSVSLDPVKPVVQLDGHTTPPAELNILSESTTPHNRKESPLRVYKVSRLTQMGAAANGPRASHSIGAGLSCFLSTPAAYAVGHEAERQQGLMP